MNSILFSLLIFGGFSGVCLSQDAVFLIQVNTTENLSFVSKSDTAIEAKVDPKMLGIKNVFKNYEVNIFYSRQPTREEKAKMTLSVIVDNPDSPMICSKVLGEFQYNDMRENRIKIHLKRGVVRLSWPEISKRGVKSPLRVLSSVESASGYKDQKVSFLNIDENGDFDFAWESSSSQFKVTIVPFPDKEEPINAEKKIWSIKSKL